MNLLNLKRKVTGSQNCQRANGYLEENDRTDKQPRHKRTNITNNHRWPPKVTIEILVYRGITGNESDRFLVTADKSIAESHSDRIRVYKIDRSKLESGFEEIGFWDGDVPADKIGDIEAFASRNDLRLMGEYKNRKNK